MSSSSNRVTAFFCKNLKVFSHPIVQTIFENNKDTVKMNFISPNAEQRKIYLELEKNKPTDIFIFGDAEWCKKMKERISSKSPTSTVRIIAF